MKENIRILLKFTLGLPIIFMGTIFLSMVWLFAWALGDRDHLDFINSIKWLWKIRR
jgi:hypothetical protein